MLLKFSLIRVIEFEGIHQCLTRSRSSDIAFFFIGDTDSSMPGVGNG